MTAPAANTSGYVDNMTLAIAPPADKPVMKIRDGSTVHFDTTASII